MKTRPPPQGFTLLELMITCAIIAILLAIALPSYQQYVKRGYRNDAKTALLENAQFLERRFTERNAYNVDSSGTAFTTTTDASAGLPIQSTPRGGDAIYDIAFTGTLDANTYTLAATAVAGGPMDGDECATLTLSQDGTRSGATGCWDR